MVPDPNRRYLVAVALAASLAGCFGDEPADDTGQDATAPGEDGTDAPADDTTQPAAEDDAADDADDDAELLTDDLPRPRVLADEAAFDRLTDLIEEEETVADWFRLLEGRASRLDLHPPKEYDIGDGVRLLPVSREVLERSLTLGLAYRLTDEVAYAERLVEELAAVADFPDWNPDHFLDVAEMTAATAIGYDWCHDAFDATEQAMIREAILTHGLEPAERAYRGLEPYSWWRTVDHNWNFVCNGGIAMGAVALYGQHAEDDEFLEYLLEQAERSIRRPFDALGPYGGWNEGPDYWVYGLQYAVYYLATMAAFDELPAFAASKPMYRTGAFPLQITGPTGAFNYGDGTPNVPSSPELFWLADNAAAPAWADARERHLARDHRVTPLDLLWYDPDHGGDVTGLPLDAHFPGGDHAATFRTAHEDATAVFLGCKAGDNESNHTALDAGTFVLDAYGTRWVPHWGRDDYNLPGYWDTGRGGDRWDYYRMRPEGQNTLVFDPSSAPSQDPEAVAEIEVFERTDAGGIAIADLSPVYERRGIASCRRGFRFERNPASVLIQDEFGADEAVDCYWFMHTEQRLSIGERTAVLSATDGAARVVAELIEPADARFDELPPEPLPSSPDPDGQADNPGTKLAIALPDRTAATIAVRLTPLPTGEDEPAETPSVRPLADWEPPTV